MIGHLNEQIDDDNVLCMCVKKYLLPFNLMLIQIQIQIQIQCLSPKIFWIL